ncbi:MAG: hypothetical protein JNM78_11255 [Cyclobacteriaceae bacterium]|nr:hypothetical protein [Cyclobacteriaceae bacterium]
MMKVLKFLLFNPLSNAYLTNETILNLSFNKRLKAMGLEFLYVLSFCIPLLLPFFILSQMLMDDVYIGQRVRTDFKLSDLFISIPFTLIYIVLFNKDFYNGQSIVHRLLGYQIVNSRTLRPADRLRCILRNITAPLWIVEGIIVLFNPQRRLGDFLAGTKIIEVNKADPEFILNEIREANYDFLAILTLILPMLFFLIGIMLNNQIYW